MSNEQTYKALADPTRRKILDLLKNGTLSAGQIAEACKTTQANISQHLNKLKACNLIDVEKKGLYVYYTLNSKIAQKDKKEIESMISIKEKILYEICEITKKNKCEPVIKPDSQDEGIIYIMKDSAATVLSFRYSFRFSSFLIELEIPLKETLCIDYDDEDKIKDFFQRIQTEISPYYQDDLKTEKERMCSIVHLRLSNYLHDFEQMNFFGAKDYKKTKELKEMIKKISQEENTTLPNDELEEFIEKMVSQLTSLGKISELAENPKINEIIITAPNEVWAIENGKRIRTKIEFENDDEVLEIAKKIAKLIGKRIDEAHPIATGHLPDGTHAHIMIPPVSYKGVTIAIQKPYKQKFSSYDLVRLGTTTQEAWTFLKNCIQAHVNILISGTVGIGKTRLLETLANEIPTENNEHIVCIDRNHELSLNQENVTYLKPNSHQFEEISMSTLINAASLFHPDYLVVSELIDGSVRELVEYSNNGNEGILATIQAKNAKNALEKSHHLFLQSNAENSIEYIQEALVKIHEIIIDLKWSKNGKRIISEISEVVHYDSGYIIKPIFKYEEEQGLVCTGQVPSVSLMNKFEERNVEIQLNFKKIAIVQKQNVLDEQLPFLIFEMAEIFKKGHTINQMWNLIRTRVQEPLKSELNILYSAIEFGKNIIDALKELKERINRPNYDLWIDSIVFSIHKGIKMESILREVVPILQDRSNDFNTNTNKETLSFSRALDTLAVITRYCDNFQEALDFTIGTIKNRKTRWEFESLRNCWNLEFSRKEKMKEFYEQTDFRLMKTLITQIKRAEAFELDIAQTLSWQAAMMRTVLKTTTAFQ